MTSAQILIIVTIILYMAGMLGIGILFNRKGATNTSDGFYIGGRSLGPVVTAMSAEASDMSSYLLMGLPGLAYIAGLAEVTWTAVGLSIGTYLNFLLVARLLRRYSERVGRISFPEDIKMRSTYCPALRRLLFLYSLSLIQHPVSRQSELCSTAFSALTIT